MGQAGDVHLSKPNLLTGFAVGQIKSEGGKACYQEVLASLDSSLVLVELVSVVS